MTKRLFLIPIIVICSYLLIDYALASLPLAAEISWALSFKIINPIIFIFLTIFLLKKVKIDFGLYNKNIYIIPFCAILIYLSFQDIQQTLDSTDTDVSVSDNILFLLSCLCVGLFEELFFRVYVFQNLRNNLKHKSILTIILLTASIFAFSHVFNAVKPGIYIPNVLVQVLSAFGFGLFFQTFYLRYKNIILPICLHGIFNYYTSYTSRLIYHNTYGIAEFDKDRFLTSLGIVSVLTFILILISISLFKSFLDINSSNNNLKK